MMLLVPSSPSSSSKDALRSKDGVGEHVVFIKEIVFPSSGGTIWVNVTDSHRRRES